MPTQLKETYDKQDDIAEPFRDLFVEKDGKFVFSGVENYTPSKEKQRLSNENSQWRNKHKEANTALEAWKQVIPSDFDTPEKLQEHLDSYEELKQKAELGGQKLDPKKVEEFAKPHIEKVTREKDKLINNVTKERDTFKAENEALKRDRDISFLSDQLRGAAGELKVLESVLAPIGNLPSELLMTAERVFEVVREDDTNSPNFGKPTKVQTRDGVGFEPGLTPKQWLEEMKTKRPHWWAPSSGSGAPGSNGTNGSTGPNPWAYDSFSPDKQNEIYRRDPKLAESMARSAGSVPMGTLPPKPVK